MGPLRRERIEPTDDWQQLEMRVQSDGQRSYELIRPVVLFRLLPGRARGGDRHGRADPLFRHWRLYGERGLASDRVAVWLYAEHLTLVFQDEPLAQYRVIYQPAKRRLKTVAEERLFATPHRSPQPRLWAWGQD